MTSRRTKISPKSGRGLGHVTPTIFGSTVGYTSDSLASCLFSFTFARLRWPHRQLYSVDVKLSTLYIVSYRVDARL